MSVKTYQYNLLMLSLSDFQYMTIIMLLKGNDEKM